MSSEEGMPDDVTDDFTLESPIFSPLPEDRHKCPMCKEKMKQPLVLSCLHVFCIDCLKKQYEEKTRDGAECHFLDCEVCKQPTSVPPKGVADLTPEYILNDLIEISDIEWMHIICTSCTAKSKAEARCQDCSNFLCPNCVTAHKLMRCFDSHKVITLDEMKKDGAAAAQTHRPIFCRCHPTENLKKYCKTCEVPVCHVCLASTHKQPEHQPVEIQDLEQSEREYLQSLVSESHCKTTSCDEASVMLMNSLGELQNQRDNAKDLINETFQSYKAILEKRKDELLVELDTIQSKKELDLMDLCNSVEKTKEKLDNGYKFTEHVLNNGSPVQLLLLKKLISTHLLPLIYNNPNPEVKVNIEFDTDRTQFEVAMKKAFGHFKKEGCKIPERPLSSLHSSFDNECFSLQSGILSPDTTVMPPLQDFMTMPPVSLHNTIGDCYPFPIIPPSVMPITRSCSVVESRSLSCNSHSQSPALSDSGISLDTGSPSSMSTAPMMNVAALAKLGTVGFNSQGIGGCTSLADVMCSASENSQITFNGQGMPGINLTGMPPISCRSPLSLPDMLPPSLRSQTSNVDTLTAFLHQNSTGILDSSGLGCLGSFGLDSSMSAYSTLNQGSLTPTLSSNTLTGVLSDSTSSLNTIGSSQSGMMNSGPPVRRTNKMSAMQIRCKFGQLGPGKGQFNSPHGFCVGADEDIIVADTNNHRIQAFEKTGEFKYQFGIPGREEGQLWYPRKVAVMKNSGKFVVCDRGSERSRMQLFSKTGHFVKKIAIRYIDIVAGLAVTTQGHIVAVDSVSPTVFVISEGGELIKWFDCSDYMREPSDIAVSNNEYFVCDFKGHCVVVFNEEGHFQRRIGCENITNYPNGIDIGDAGDVLIGDSHGNRFHVAVFQRDGSLIGEFECPYVKVSRCCGLKITSEGYVVTLAKNNHHVLVLNTLYIV